MGVFTLATVKCLSDQYYVLHVARPITTAALNGETRLFDGVGLQQAQTTSYFMHVYEPDRMDIGTLQCFITS